MKSLLSVSVSSSDDGKLPTLRQYLKKIGRGAIAKQHIVTVVWKPNQFPNYTFETEYYKVRISENNPIYKELSSFLLECYLKNIPVAIAISENRDGSFELVEAEGENVEWDTLGENGYKQKVLPKRDSAKPASQGKKGEA